MAESSSCKVFCGLGEVCGYMANEASRSAYVDILDVGKDVVEDVGRAADVLSRALRYEGLMVGKRLIPNRALR